MKKRILLMVSTLERAGTEKQMGLLGRELPREEFEVHVCAFGRGGPMAAELAEANIPLKVIETRGTLDPLAFTRLWRHVAQVAPQLVHTWTFETNVCGYLAAKVAGVRHVIASQRWPNPWETGLQLRADRFVAARVARITVNSHSVAEFYTQRGRPAEKFLAIANGVAPTPTSTTTRGQWLDELGLPPESRLIGFIGGLVRRKRVKDAIWSADLLKVIRDDVHLLVIGKGPHHDRLLKFRDQVRIRDKVHFLGVRGDVPRILPHFDVLWSTSGHEGHSNAIMEAMAAGVPVVAADTAGTRDLIEHETTGYLAAMGDRAGFARYANKLIDDRELAQRLGKAGQQRMREHFSVEQMVGQYAQLYREVLG